jgi:hypothetical protein
MRPVFELRVRDPGGREPTRFELAIAGGACEVRARAARDPGAGVELGADDTIRLVSGASGWPELLSSGRLALTGDPFLATISELFRLPAGAPGRVRR